MARLVQDLLARQAHRLVIDTRNIAAWCFGAGREWRKRIDPIVNTVVDLG